MIASGETIRSFDNVKMDGPGTYKLTYRFTPPEANGFYRHTDLDPERDTAAHLAEYVPFFHPRLLGLTGDAAHIRDAARAYRVCYAKVVIDGAVEYTIDHSGFIYLMDRDGKYLGFFPPGTPAGRMAAVIEAHLAAGH